MEDSFIQIQGLYKGFQSQPVLRGVDLTIHRGDSIVIIGQSGCGKSVLLKHIVRLLEPDQGRVVFDGEDIEHLKFSQLISVRQRIGMLFQSAALFDSMTVAENVGLGLRKDRL